MADETAAGAAEPRAQPKKKRCRDRSNEPWYASRSSTINVPRAYPNYVDMAQLSLLRPVRYDTERDMYDLLDAMTTAYSSKRPLRGMHKKMGANFGLSKTEFTRIKWSDDANNGGTGRMMASARNCARVLRNSATHRPKNAPHQRRANRHLVRQPGQTPHATDPAPGHRVPERNRQCARLSTPVSVVYRPKSLHKPNTLSHSHTLTHSLTHSHICSSERRIASSI